MAADALARIGAAANAAMMQSGPPPAQPLAQPQAQPARKSKFSDGPPPTPQGFTEESQGPRAGRGLVVASDTGPMAAQMNADTIAATARVMSFLTDTTTGECCLCSLVSR